MAVGVALTGFGLTDSAITNLALTDLALPDLAITDLALTGLARSLPGGVAAQARKPTCGSMGVCYAVASFFDGGSGVGVASFAGPELSSTKKRQNQERQSQADCPFPGSPVVSRGVACCHRQFSGRKNH